MNWGSFFNRRDMKRTRLHHSLLLISVSAFIQLTAELIYEPFASGTTPGDGEYVDGANLGGANPTVSGFTGGWSTATQRWITDADGLVYSSGNVSLGSASTGTVMRRISGGGTSSQLSSRSMSSANAYNTPRDYWFAVLLNPGEVDGAEITELRFQIDDGGVPININMTGSDLFLEGSDQGDVSVGVTTMVLGRVSVAVVGNGVGDEDIDFWVNPSDLSSIGALGAATYSTTGNYQNGQSYGPDNITIEMAGSVGSNNRVDEFVLTDSFSELQSVAYVIPEPGSLALVTLAGLGIFAIRSRKR